MAVPLTFEPKAVDPHLELRKRLDAAPREHAEALLVVYDILETAHANGTLDAVHGMVFARDKIFARLAAMAKTEVGETALLNLLQGAKLLATLNPDVLQHLSLAAEGGIDAYTKETKPPSTWELFRRATSEDGRRGLSFMTHLLTSLGKAQK